MKLQAERMIVLKRFDRKFAALSQQFGARRESKAFGVPVIDLIRPIWADIETRRRRTDRVISDLRATLGMRPHRRAELPRQHLRPKANPQERPLLPQRHRNPVDLAPNEFIRIVRAHRSAEYDCAGMTVQRFRKAIAKSRTPDIQGMPERPQRIADAAGCRGFLMQDDQNRQRWSGYRGRDRRRPHS